VRQKKVFEKGLKTLIKPEVAEFISFFYCWFKVARQVFLGGKFFVGKVF
jgi:hypothetical protein